VSASWHISEERSVSHDLIYSRINATERPPSGGLSFCARRADNVPENDPVGVAFEYEVLE
jgi:hypothetical protein